MLRKLFWVLMLLAIFVIATAENYNYTIHAEGTIDDLETFESQLDTAMASQFSTGYYTIECSSQTATRYVTIVGERTEAMGDLDNETIKNYLFARIGNCQLVLETDKVFYYDEVE